MRKLGHNKDKVLIEEQSFESYLGESWKLAK